MRTPPLPIAACVVISVSCMLGCAAAAVRLPRGAVVSSTSSPQLSGPWRQTQKLRELTAKHDVQVAVLDDATFDEALKDRLVDDKAAELKRPAAARFLVALGFSEPSADLQRSLDGMVTNQTVGFYDHDAKMLFMKRGASVEEQRATLVHELGHALQDQTFGIPGRAKDEDRTLAQKALFEGDAMLTMVADALETAKQRNPDNAAPLSVGAERLRMFLQSQPAGAVFNVTGQHKAAGDAPLFLREVLLFPYSAGFELAAALYRTGGYVLLNEAFKKLPVSTEQVLHPEKYVRGEQPVKISAPPPPPGMRLVAQDVFGELGLRSLLLQALPPYPAQNGAGGWGGDVISLYEDRETKALVVSASTTWDSELDAVEFVAGMERVIAAWGDGFVRRRGSDVAFVRGLKEAHADKELDRLLSLPREAAPPSPPLGKVTLVPPPQLPETSVTRGTVSGSTYEHPRFALSSHIPDGFSANLSVQGVDLMIRTELGATGIFTASHAPYNQTNTDAFFKNVALAFGSQLGDSVHLETMRTGRTTVLDRVGEERVLAVSGTGITIRVVVVPTCDHEWIYGFVMSSLGPADVTALDGWLRSHKESGPPPACHED